MSILIVKDYGISLQYRKGLVVISKKGTILRKVPLMSLEAIYILTGGVMISSKLARMAARTGVDVIFFDHKGTPLARLDPPYHTRTVLTRRMQYEAYNLSLIHI